MKTLLLTFLVITGLPGAVLGKTADLSSSEPANKIYMKLLADQPIPTKGKKCPSLVADQPIPTKGKKCPSLVADQPIPTKGKKCPSLVS